MPRIGSHNATPSLARLLAALTALAAGWAPAPVSVRADDGIAAHYGFSGLDIVKVGDAAGPVAVADMDGDGEKDIIVGNDRRSRIEVHLQKKGASADDAVAPSKVNEIPEHWRYRRVEVPASEAVAAIVPFDFDHDGRMDLIHVGNGEKLVFTRQVSPGVFEVTKRHKVKKLLPGRDALRVANVIGDDARELLAIADGRIQIFPLDSDTIKAPIELSAGTANMVALVVEDFDGDGTQDVLGLTPEDAAPIRAWFGSKQDGKSTLGPQSRFEMPPLHDATAVRVPGNESALLATIERPSKRVVLYKLGREAITDAGGDSGSIRTWAFTDPSNRKRQVSVADITGDGLPEVIATNTERNAISIFGQRAGAGLTGSVDAPSFADLDSLVVADLDADGKAEVLVASEKEGVAGIARADGSGKLGFPEGLPLDKGRVPGALGVVSIGGAPWIAVVTKDGRDYTLELLPAAHPATGKVSVALGSLSRAPSSILPLDADQNGRTDILLFTPDKPMMMVVQGDPKEGETTPTFKLVESKDMAQFGLAQAATSDNSAAVDIDGDGKDELVIADRNYLRALRVTPEGAWSVVTQVNAPRGDAKLIALDRLGARLAALDKENAQILLFSKGADGAWSADQSVPIGDGNFTAIRAGRLTGGDAESLLLVGPDAFGVLAFGGERPTLETISTWRSDSTERTPHEFIVGDVNADGLTDIVTLDAAEQMLDVLSLSEANNLMHALGFEVFESKMFSGGDRRVFEPSQGIIADVTGDGADDIVLMCHDRILIYPQMVDQK